MADTESWIRQWENVMNTKKKKKRENLNNDFPHFGLPADLTQCFRYQKVYQANLLNLFFFFFLKNFACVEFLKLNITFYISASARC